MGDEDDERQYGLPKNKSPMRCARRRAGRRRLGVSEASFYLWKKKCGSAAVRQACMTEVREMRQLRDESARLKRLVADLTVDKHILGEVRKKL